MAIEWIEEEAERIRAERQQQQNQIVQNRDTESRIRHQWDKMRGTIREHASGFNSNATIQERYGRKLEIVDDGWAGLQIKSVIFPAIYMKIELDGQTLKLDWTVITPTHLERWTQNALANMEFQEKEEFSETLEIIEGPVGEIIFDGPNGRHDFSGLPQYILTKFLVDHTVFPGRY